MVILTVMYPLAMPANLITFYKSMMPIVCFDMIETLQEVDAINVWISYVVGSDFEVLNIRD